MTPSLQASLTRARREVIPANTLLVVMDYYLIPYGLFLGATPQQVGLLVAIPHLMGSFSQVFAAESVRWVGSCLKLLLRGSIVQAAVFVLMALLVLAPAAWKIPLLIALAAVFRILMNLLGTAWGGLMSEYLQPHERGSYLGMRSRLGGLATLGGLMVAGVLLFILRKVSLELGFFLLLSSAAFSRLWSTLLFRGMLDFPHKETAQSRFTLYMFLSRLRESNFVKYVLFVSAMTFATQVATPYFAVYMLRDLGWSYVQYTLLHTMSVLTGLISFPLWGRHADQVGNARVLKSTGLLVPLVPVLWLLSHNFYYLLAAEAFAGFVWGGFNLCAANYVFDAVSPEKRVRCLGYFNLFCGLAIFLGAALGGYLAERLPVLLGSNLLTLFLLSGLLRFAAYFILAGSFREVRAGVRSVGSIKLFFSVLGIRPLVGSNRPQYSI